MHSDSPPKRHVPAGRWAAPAEPPDAWERPGDHERPAERGAVRRGVSNGPLHPGSSKRSSNVSDSPKGAASRSLDAEGHPSGDTRPHDASTGPAQGRQRGVHSVVAARRRQPDAEKLAVLHEVNDQVDEPSARQVQQRVEPDVERRTHSHASPPHGTGEPSRASEDLEEEATLRHEGRRGALAFLGQERIDPATVHDLSRKQAPVVGEARGPIHGILLRADMSPPPGDA